MSDVQDLIPAFKRSVAVPGGFDALFPSVVDTEIIGVIYDAIAEAKLDGFLRGFEVDPDLEEVTPDLSRDEAINEAGALVMLYAAYRVVLNELRNVTNRQVYEAGPTKYETERTASMLNEILRQLHQRKVDLLARADKARLSTSVFVGDLTFIKATSDGNISAALAYSPFRGV